MMYLALTRFLDIDEYPHSDSQMLDANIPEIFRAAMAQSGIDVTLLPVWPVIKDSPRATVDFCGRVVVALDGKELSADVVKSVMEEVEP